MRKANLCQTLATCQMFNAEVCYGSGLQYNTDSCGGDVKREVEDFLLDNALPSYFLGVCQDFKHFAFCVSVVILNTDGTRIVRLIRKERLTADVLSGEPKLKVGFVMNREEKVKRKPLIINNFRFHRVQDEDIMVVLADLEFLENDI